MLKSAFYVISICLMLVLIGCAQLKLQKNIWDQALEPITPGQWQELPLTGSSHKADILYRLLVAEIAGRSGDYALALKHYLEVAEQVLDPQVAERAARIALYLNDLEKLKRAVKLWLERAPHSLDAHKVALMLALQAGELTPAVTHFSQMLALAGDNQTEILLDILRFMDQNVPKETALKVMAAVSQRFPRSPEVFYAHAVLALRKGEAQLALEQISRAVALQPDWPKLRLLQSQLLLQLGEDSQARQILQKLVKKHPQDVQLRLLYAQLLLKQQAFDQAWLELRRILKQEPDHPDALYAYALVNLQQGRDEAAVQSLLRLLKQPKWRNEAYFYLGRIFTRQGKYQEALGWFDRIDQQGELAFDAQVQSVAVLAKLGRMQEAWQRMDQLRSRFPGRKLQLYLLEAELRTNQKDYEGAFTTLTRALEEFPEYPDLFYARALVAEQIDKVEVAIEDLKAAVEKRPEDPNLLNALGYMLLEHTDQIQAARGYLDKAIRLKPDDPAILDSYGWLWYKLGDYAQARKYLQQAYSLNPDPEIAFHLGETLWALGQKQEARRLWREILKATSDERVRSLIERVRNRLKP